MTDHKHMHKPADQTAVGESVRSAPDAVEGAPPTEGHIDEGVPHLLGEFSAKPVVAEGEEDDGTDE